MAVAEKLQRFEETRIIPSERRKTERKIVETDCKINCEGRERN